MAGPRRRNRSTPRGPQPRGSLSRPSTAVRRPPSGAPFRVSLPRRLPSASPRAIVAVVTAGVGGLGAAVTALVTGLETEAGWTVYGALIGGFGGGVLAPRLVGRRSGGRTALAIVLFAVGVLAFPLFLNPLTLEAPIVGRLGGGGFVPELTAWLFTPIGYFVAAPFVPAVLVTAVAAPALVKRLVPPPTGRASAPVAAGADLDGDRRFGRAVSIAAAVLFGLAGLGYVALAWGSTAIGY